MKLTRKERILKLLNTMGYKQVPTRNLKYAKYAADNKLNMWLGERGVIKTGKTLHTSIHIKVEELDNLFKRYKI